MTTTAPAPAPAPHRPRPSLLRAEWRRYRSRRFVRVLLGLGLLGFLAGVLIASAQFGKATPEALAEARERVAGFIAENERYRQQCLEDPPLGAPVGASPEELCGPPPTADSYGGLQDYLDAPPFVLAEDGPNGAEGLAFATSALAFLLGATFIGAEWSTRSLVALLFWEPRRPRVMGAKLTVLVVTTAAIAASVQLLWLGAARLLAETRGDPTVPDGFYGELLGTAVRGGLVAVVAALLGFGIANAVRHTAASLGVGFVYFAVVENVVRALKPTWAQGLVTDNAVALLQDDPYVITVSESSVDENGVYGEALRSIVITHAEAALVLGGITAAVVAVGVVLFLRRDLT